jgi:hypothetical protein
MALTAIMSQHSGGAGVRVRKNDFSLKPVKSKRVRQRLQQQQPQFPSLPQAQPHLLRPPQRNQRNNQQFQRQPPTKNEPSGPAFADRNVTALRAA